MKWHLIVGTWLALRNYKNNTTEIITFKMNYKTITRNCAFHLLIHYARLKWEKNFKIQILAHAYVGMIMTGMLEMAID